MKLTLTLIEAIRNVPDALDSLKGAVARHHQLPNYNVVIEDYDNTEGFLNFFKNANTEEKLKAIKVFRDLTGMGLKEAKDCIDVLFGRLQTPDAKFLSSQAVESAIEKVYKEANKMESKYDGYNHSSGAVIKAINDLKHELKL